MITQPLSRPASWMKLSHIQVNHSQRNPHSSLLDLEMQDKKRDCHLSWRRRLFHPRADFIGLCLLSCRSSPTFGKTATGLINSAPALSSSHSAALVFTDVDNEVVAALKIEEDVRARPSSAEFPHNQVRFFKEAELCHFLEHDSSTKLSVCSHHNNDALQSHLFVPWPHLRWDAGPIRGPRRSHVCCEKKAAEAMS